MTLTFDLHLAPRLTHHRVHYIEASADFSDCGHYRYRLKRRWAPGPALMFIQLNPSQPPAPSATTPRCAATSGSRSASATAPSRHSTSMPPRPPIRAILPPWLIRSGPTTTPTSTGPPPNTI